MPKTVNVKRHSREKEDGSRTTVRAHKRVIKSGKYRVPILSEDKYQRKHDGTLHELEDKIENASEYAQRQKADWNERVLLLDEEHGKVEGEISRGNR